MISKHHGRLRKLEDKDTYSRSEVDDIVRDAVADFARKLMLAENTHNAEERMYLLQGAIRNSTLYDEDDDDDDWI